MSSKPRTILVSGASRGIGAAICAALLGVGHTVVGISRDFSQTAQTANFYPYPVDLADTAGLPDRLRTISNNHPTIDALVCNAGFGRFGGLEEFSSRHIESMITVNLTAQILLVRSLLPGIKRNSGGDILFIGSEAGLSGGRRGAVYSASKAGLRGFAQALREECAGGKTRVCIINPGPVRTGFFDELNFAPGPQPTHALAPTDIAEAVLFVLKQQPGAVIDEINLSPLQTVWQFNKRVSNDTE